MTVSEAPSVRAMSLAPRTSSSAPMSSATRPTAVVVRLRPRGESSSAPVEVPASSLRPQRTERTLNTMSDAASTSPTGRDTTPAAASGQRRSVAASMNQNSRRSRPPRHRERGHDRGDPQDQSQVGRVAADDVPHREPRALAEHRHQAGADLRRRSAVGDDGQPDHQRADVKPPREARGAVHEPVRPVGESGKPEEREDAGEENQAGTPARGRLRAAPEDRAFGARL